ncbi:TolC family protein [Ohtaekwangia sp.]|uniref:TolC family protein n=1 Tax=Ohtaekwangia sp. TaxID=2066019 RepID=UPI002FDE526D
MNIRFTLTIFVVFIFLCVGQAQEMITVEQAVALAIEKNYDIKLSENILSSVELDNSYAFGAFLPQLNGSASRVWNTSNQKQLLADNSTRQQKGLKSNTQAAAVQLTWTLFDGTKMFATRERLEELVRQGEINVKGQITNTVAQVITNYFNIVQQKQQLKATQEQMSVSEERVKLAEKKLQVGTGGKPELLQAKVDLNTQRTQVLQQEAAIAQLKEQLRGLVGMQLPELYDVSDTIIIDLGLKREDIELNIANQNFALLSAKRDIEIARLALHERKAEQFPTISFNSAYSYNKSTNAVSLNPGIPLYSQSNGYNYGFSAAIPILGGFNRRRLVQQAKITLSRQQTIYDQQKYMVDVGVRNAYVNYDNAKQVLLVEEETILLAKENVFIALEGFKRGITTFIELRTAQQSLADAYNRLINARYLAKVAETELLRLNGSLLK